MAREANSVVLTLSAEDARVIAAVLRDHAGKRWDGDAVTARRIASRIGSAFDLMAGRKAFREYNKRVARVKRARARVYEVSA